MSARQLAGFARRPVQIKTANYTVTKADVASVIVAIGATSWTLALPAAAAAGAGFTVTLRNAGTGKVTIDPNGSETVNGVTTLGCYQQDTVELVCDGTGWLALFDKTTSIVEKVNSSVAVAQADILLPTEFSSFTLKIRRLRPSVAAQPLMRISLDGTTYAAASGNYLWTTEADNVGGSVGQWGSDDATSAAFIICPFQQSSSNNHYQTVMEIDPAGAAEYGSALYDSTSFAASGAFTHASGSAMRNAIGRWLGLRLLFDAGNIARIEYDLLGNR